MKKPCAVCGTIFKLKKKCVTAEDRTLCYQCRVEVAHYKDCDYCIHCGENTCPNIADLSCFEYIRR
jgi:hypothetical protein